MPVRRENLPWRLSCSPCVGRWLPSSPVIWSHQAASEKGGRDNIFLSRDGPGAGQVTHELRPRALVRMIIRPPDRPELCRRLREANACGNVISQIDLSSLARVIEHTPEDMTVTVESGITLAALQRELSRHRQWLPLDPPHPESLSIAQLISRNASGPRRFGFGTVRDYLLGLQVALADGRLVRSGGRVVKNVAGFDVMKLFIGGQDSLGVIVEATFKLLPVPEVERFVQRRCVSITEACRTVDAVLDSSLTPSVLDLHNIGTGGALSVVVGVSGSAEDVNWQLDHATKLGFTEDATLDDAADFWRDVNLPGRTSVLPERLASAIEQLGAVPFVARAGNGVIYHRGAVVKEASSHTGNLSQRLKHTFDPNGIFPSLRVS